MYSLVNKLKKDVMGLMCFEVDRIQALLNEGGGEGGSWWLYTRVWSMDMLLEFIKWAHIVSGGRHQVKLTVRRKKITKSANMFLAGVFGNFFHFCSLIFWRRCSSK